MSFTFGKGKTHYVERNKTKQMKVELRLLLNDLTPTLHPASEESRKVRRFIEEYLDIPMNEVRGPIERGFERL